MRWLLFQKSRNTLPLFLSNFNLLLWDFKVRNLAGSNIEIRGHVRYLSSFLEPWRAHAQTLCQVHSGRSEFTNRFIPCFLKFSSSGTHVHGSADREETDHWVLTVIIFVLILDAVLERCEVLFGFLCNFWRQLRFNERWALWVHNPLHALVQEALHHVVVWQRCFGSGILRMIQSCDGSSWPRIALIHKYPWWGGVFTARFLDIKSVSFNIHCWLTPTPFFGGLFWWALFHLCGRPLILSLFLSSLRLF
jgi:hypothetical protein